MNCVVHRMALLPGPLHHVRCTARVRACGLRITECSPIPRTEQTSSGLTGKPQRPTLCKPANAFIGITLQERRDSRIVYLMGQHTRTIMRYSRRFGSPPSLGLVGLGLGLVGVCAVILLQANDSCLLNAVARFSSTILCETEPGIPLWNRDVQGVNPAFPVWDMPSSLTKQQALAWRASGVGVRGCPMHCRGLPSPTDALTGPLTSRLQAQHPPRARCKLGQQTPCRRRNCRRRRFRGRRSKVSKRGT